MSHPTLFSLDEPIVPATDRTEPVLWLRRVVILPSLDSDAPIREIPFRRGLNFVQTRLRPPGEPAVVGHSVGKTLLTRLIRYTLGEQHFAAESVRSRIARKFPTAYVVAVWSVRGAEWIVARPLKEGHPGDSLSVPTDDWQTGILQRETHQPFEAFLAAVDRAVLFGLPEFTLPRAGRTPSWLDVLAWLARDSECGYRASNEWRHEDAASGTRVSRRDNSLVMQWLAGLMELEEVELRRAHRGLLQSRRAAQVDREASQKVIEVTAPVLLSRLNASPTDDLEGLFAVPVVTHADNQIGSLARLLEDRRGSSNLAALEATEARAADELADAKASLREAQSQIQIYQGLITQMLSAGEKGRYFLGSPYEECTAGTACPMKVENRPAPPVDPAREDHLASLRDQLSEVEKSLPALIEQRDVCNAAHRAAKQAVRAEQKRLEVEMSGIDRDIGRWESYREDAVRHQDARRTLEEAHRLHSRLSVRIAESKRAQRAARKKLSERLERFSECYLRILKDVFGKSAAGSIKLDRKGLHPVPNNRLAPNGTALKVMTSVLAFDVATVVASIAGIGHHPRFLIHDSPRGGDMEEPLFHRLFESVRRLELLFGEKEPSFQYIVTTTTRPPPELADETGPFVRLTLDARSSAEHLLCDVY